MPGNRVGVTAIWDNKNFTDGQKAYIKKLVEALSETKKVAAASAVTGNIMATALGTALGFMAAKAMSAFSVFGDALRDASAYIWETTGSIQQLTVALEVLSAREVLWSGQAANIGQAFQISGGHAQELMENLREIALTSPFDYQDIVKTFRMNVAFGMTTDMSLKLTDALLDLTAGVGLSSEFLERIAYNFSQMSLYGKVTMRDIRDLAWAGIDVNKVFKTQLNMTLKQVNEGLETGALSFEDLTHAFINFAKETTGGAGERMLKTLPGLAIAFENLRTFAVADIFGPSMQIVAETLHDIYLAAKEIADSGKLKEIGENLAKITRNAIDLGERGWKAIKSFFGFFENTLGITSDNAYNWGHNIIVNLASGIINAGATILIGAFDFIAGVFESFLAPHSPPKIVANIVEWGRDTMGYFLHGFTDADFSVLKTLSSPIRQFLSALFSGTENAFVGTGAFINIYRELIQSFAGGGTAISAGALDAIRGSLGEYANEIIELANAQMASADATKEVEEAEKSLDRQRKLTETLNSTINDMVMEYNQTLRDGVSPEVLTAKRKEIDNTIKSRDASRLAAVQAEKDLELAKEKEDAAKDQFEWQQSLVSVLLELAQAQAQYNREVEAARKAAEKDKEEATLPEEELLEPINMQNFLKRQEVIARNSEEDGRKIGQGFLDGIFAAIQEGIGAKMEELRVSFENAGKSVVAAFEVIKQDIENLDIFGFISTEDLAAAQARLEEFGKFLSRWWDEYGGYIKWNIGFVAHLIWRFFWNIADSIMTTWEILSSGFYTSVDFVIKAVGYFWTALGELQKAFYKILHGDFRGFLEAMYQVGENYLDYIVGLFRGFVSSVVVSILSQLLFAADMVSKLFAYIITGKAISPLKLLKDNADLLGDYAEAIMDIIGQSNFDVKDSFEDTYGTGSGSVPSVFSGAMAGIGDVWDKPGGGKDTLWSVSDAAWGITGDFYNAGDSMDFMSSALDSVNADAFRDNVAWPLMDDLSLLDWLARSFLDSLNQIASVGQYGAFTNYIAPYGPPLPNILGTSSVLSPSPVAGAQFSSPAQQNIVINFGGQTLNNNLDVVAFRTMVLKTLNEAM